MALSCEIELLKKQSKLGTDIQVLINRFKYVNPISKEWDIDSYSYVNEYGELMLNEECCKTFKIPKSLRPFVLFSSELHQTLISNYRYDFGSKLLEFLGVNTKFDAPGCGLKQDYKEDLKSRWFILHELSYQINYMINMYDHNPNMKEKEILNKYSDLEKEQENGI